MPKQVESVKEFIAIARSDIAGPVDVRRNTKSDQVKFRVRLSRKTYTLTVNDKFTANRLEKALIENGSVNPPKDQQ
ncbi:hypothetical protein P9112_012967 [Eukaryota sp. TZLM1-RC]